MMLVAGHIQVVPVRAEQSGLIAVKPRHIDQKPPSRPQEFMESSGYPMRIQQMLQYMPECHYVEVLERYFRKEDVPVVDSQIGKAGFHDGNCLGYVLDARPLPSTAVKRQEKAGVRTAYIQDAAQYDDITLVVLGRE